MEFEFLPPPKVALTYMKILCVIQCSIVIVLIGVASWLWLYFDLWMIMIYVFAIIAVMALIFFIAKPFIYYRYYTYRITAHHIEIQKRWWFRKYEVIQIERIQSISRENGPLQRHYQLQQLHCTTAGHSIQLPLVLDEDAKRIEAYCMNQLKGGDADV